MRGEIGEIRDATLDGVLAALVALGALAAASGPVAGQDEAAALPGYDSLVRASMDAWRVPGAAVAVVRDGEAVLVRGYGVKRGGGDDTVTAETVFPVGSTTKSFTALAVADLVEAGELSLDEPVREYLPGFRLPSDQATAHATLEDLLSHRTGLARHDYLLRGDGEPFDRNELMARLRHLHMAHGFREAFQYNNFMYMAAGRVAGRTSGTSWEEVVRSRLLDPMGMEDTGFGQDFYLEAADRARGHRTPPSGASSGDSLPAPVRQDFVRNDAIGPAGSLMSTASDMARWVETVAGEGKLDGKRVVPAAALEETTTPRMPAPGLAESLLGQPEMSHVSYGLGWFVQDYRGYELVHHSGGIGGFSAVVAVLPREDAGVVVLCNNQSGAMFYALALATFDRLLGLDPVDWNARFLDEVSKMRAAAGSGGQDDSADADAPEDSPDHELAEYAGTYAHPAYGEVPVRETDGGLVAEYHGIRVRLRHRTHDVFGGEVDPEHWVLAGHDLVFHFRTDRRGEIDAVELNLAPTSGRPVVFERRASPGLSDRAYLERFAGDYAVAGRTAEVRLNEAGTLTIRIPGQPRLELVPDGRNHFTVKGRAGIELEFEVSGGSVEAMVIRQAGRTMRGEPQ